MCSKPFLFASLITFYLDMRHLLQNSRTRGFI